MRPYPRVNLNANPVEFYCPHCETVILTAYENEDKEIPKICPSCKKEIDTTGAQPYEGPLKK